MSAMSGAEPHPPPGLADHGAFERIGAPLLVSCSAGCLLGASVLAGGGAGDGSIPWVGGASVAVLALLVALALAGWLPMPAPARLGSISIGLFLALVAWMGISVAWSFGPDLTWSYFNRGLTYASLLGVGLFFAAAVPRAPTVLAAALSVLVAAVVVWSLAGKIDPSLFEDGFRRARLREPLGLWNALGLMFAYGVPLSLWLARRRHSSLVRALATGFLFLLVPALILTLSRAGIIAALAVAAAWLVLSSGRLETLAAVLLSVPAGAVVAAWALRQPGIADERQELAVRAADGRALGVVLAAGFAAVVLVAFALYAAERRRPLSEERRRRIVSAAAWLATLLAIVAIVVAVVRVGDPADWVEARFDEFTSPELLTNEAGRLTSTSSNARWRWWQEAADAWTDNPLVGTGAGSFPVVHRLYRDDSLTVRQPHNIVLQFLAETGIVGLLLLVASAVAGLVAAWRMVRAYEVPERPAGLALLLVLAIYGLHSVVEVDWDFLALSAPVFFGAGVLLAYGRSRWLEDARAAGILPAAVLGLCIVSLILPPLSSQAVSRSAERLAEDPAAALDAARAAAALNPVALDPLLARAEAEITLGRPDRARAAYEQATRTQPRNARGWFAMASFEADLGNLSAARAAYVQAKARDPRSCTVLALGVELGLEPQGCTGPRS